MKHSSLFSVSLLLLLEFFPRCNTEKESAKEKNKPNILFLFADVQRTDTLGCAGAWFSGGGRSLEKKPDINRFSFFLHKTFYEIIF